MARRRVKKRTQIGAQNGADSGAKGKPMDRGPKSMVIRMGAGDVGPSVTQLVKDTRRMMEPGTASRLKERRANKLRDYTTMCGPLGVSHLLLFSRSKSGNTNLRLAVTPRGPTLHFRVERYSLCKDVMRSQKRPKGGTEVDFLSPPLLVMNNFMTPPQADNAANSNTPVVPKHLEQLTTTVFQSLFPPISPQTTPLNSIRRVLLLNRDPPSSNPSADSSSDVSNGAYTITLRHYDITTPLARSSRPDLPRPIRKLQNAGGRDPKKPTKKAAIPDLGKLQDVSEYLLDPAAAGYTSVTESEGETEAEVEVAAPLQRKALGQKDRDKMRAKREAATAAAENGDGKPDANLRRENGVQVEQRAVKLTELGPRMRLRLVKVEEGLCTGKVMWHEFVEKSAEEVQKMDAEWEHKRHEKEERRKAQKENVERKRKEKGKGGKGENGAKEDDEDDEENFDESDMDEDWDDEDEDMDVEDAE